MSSNNRTCESGTRSLGLTMKVLPHATACGRNHIGTMAGKLNGVIAANTPIGCRTVWQSMPAAMSSSEVPIMRSWMPKARSTLSIARRTLLRDSSSVFPCSRVTTRATSSRCSSRRFLSLKSGLTRWTGGVWRHAGNASSAALTARSTSAAVPSGTRAKSSSLAGFLTSPKRVASEATQRPPT